MLRRLAAAGRLGRWLFLLGLLLGPALACGAAEPEGAAAAGTNHVLVLGGRGAHVELPADSVRGLTRSTVECWVMWEDLGNGQRIFNLGQPRRDISLMNDGEASGRTLAFVIGDEKGGLRWHRVHNALRSGVWMNLAAVSGPGGMRVYINGEPYASPVPYSGSFAAVAQDGPFYLGRSVTPSDGGGTFQGAIDEFRVWDHERTPEQVRADMFTSVPAGTPGLVLSLDFEGPESGAGLRGGARVEPGRVPARAVDLAGLPMGRISRGPEGGDRTRGATGAAGMLFVAGLLTAFCLFHGLLFVFQPTLRTHLYFALISGMGVIASWPTTLLGGVSRHDFPVLAVAVLRLFQLLFTPEAKPPARSLAVGAVVLTLTTLVWSALFPADTGPVLSLLGAGAFCVVAICTVRVLRIAWMAWKARMPGSRPVGAGLAALILFSGLTTEIPYMGGISLGQLSVALFFGATSVHLARTFAEAAARLERQAADLSESNRRMREANEQIEAQRRELAEAKDAAEAASIAKSRFLASVSHELRTPLNAVIGYSEMLMEEAADLQQKTLVPDLEKIHKAGRHLLELINDVLDLSKIEAGRMTLFVEEFPLGRLVGEVASTVQPLVEKRRNRLIVDCPRDAGTLHSDVTKVRQVLYNLLSNAAKFTEDGTIRLTVTRQPAVGGSGEDVVFTVSDTGIGITPEQMVRLFQPFEQADAQTSRRYGGTGLGLAISRRFARLLGGDVTADSAAGQGSSFTLRLPSQPPDPAEPPLLAAPEGLPSSAGTDPGSGLSSGPGQTPAGPLVLVIDDDPATCDLMRRALIKEGHAVEVASSGAAGIHLARTLKPAVITLDVAMPGMDGWSVLSALKSDPMTAEIPVAMVTIHEDRRRAFALGATEFLTKPIDWARMERLLERVRPAPRNEARVLIVDDDPDGSDLLARNLRSAGWSPMHARNGRIALETLSQVRPDVIFLDLMMPVMDGFEFLAALRERDPAPPPVIVLTSKDLSAAEREQLQGGVHRVLQKAGLSQEQLIAEVRSVLRSRFRPFPDGARG